MTSCTWWRPPLINKCKSCTFCQIFREQCPFFWEDIRGLNYSHSSSENLCHHRNSFDRGDGSDNDNNWIQWLTDVLPIIHSPGISSRKFLTPFIPKKKKKLIESLVFKTSSLGSLILRNALCFYCWNRGFSWVPASLIHFSLKILKKTRHWPL